MIGRRRGVDMEELENEASKLSNHQVEIIEKAIEAINNYILLLEKDKEDNNRSLIDSMIDLRDKLDDKKADLKNPI